MVVASVCILLGVGCAIANSPDPPRTAGQSATAFEAPVVKAMELKGSPAIRLRLDREYAVIEMRPESSGDAPAKDLRSWMFVPKDEQSSAVFGIGAGGHRKTEQVIARMYEGARVTKIPGTVAGAVVEWWHYKDSNHLYSTCYATLLDKAGLEHPVYFELVANRPERLTALEEAFSGIELQ